MQKWILRKNKIVLAYSDRPLDYGLWKVFTLKQPSIISHQFKTSFSGLTCLNIADNNGWWLWLHTLLAVIVTVLLRLRKSQLLGTISYQVHQFMELVSARDCTEKNETDVLGSSWFCNNAWQICCKIHQICLVFSFLMRYSAFMYLSSFQRYEQKYSKNVCHFTIFARKNMLKCC